MNETREKATNKTNNSEQTEYSDVVTQEVKGHITGLLMQWEEKGKLAYDTAWVYNRKKPPENVMSKGRVNKILYEQASAILEFKGSEYIFHPDDVYGKTEVFNSITEGSIVNFRIVDDLGIRPWIEVGPRHLREERNRKNQMYFDRYTLEEIAKNSPEVFITIRKSNIL